MGKTFRKPSKYRLLLEKGIKKLRDGAYTRPFHSCKNHGNCNWCKDNRLHKHEKQTTLKEELVLEND